MEHSERDRFSRSMLNQKSSDVLGGRTLALGWLIMMLGDMTAVATVGALLQEWNRFEWHYTEVQERIAVAYEEWRTRIPLTRPEVVVTTEEFEDEGLTIPGGTLIAIHTYDDTTGYILGHPVLTGISNTRTILVNVAPDQYLALGEIVK